MEVIHGIVMTVVYFGVGYITSALWYHSNKFIDRFGIGLLWPLTLPMWIILEFIPAIYYCLYRKNNK